jgi:hypothetical protein
MAGLLSQPAALPISHLRRQSVMVLDLAKVMARKQERECARLDEFDFRHRARAIRLLADWVRGRLPDPDSIDPVAYASQVAVREPAGIVAELKARCAPDLPEREWRRQVERTAAEARLSLVTELGDPSPHRLA